MTTHEPESYDAYKIAIKTLLDQINEKKIEVQTANVGKKQGDMDMIFYTDKNFMALFMRCIYLIYQFIITYAVYDKVHDVKKFKKIIDAFYKKTDEFIDFSKTIENDEATHYRETLEYYKASMQELLSDDIILK
jgi:hypothetical protein